MRADFVQYRTMAGFAVAIPVAASIWLFTASSGSSAATVAAIGVLLVGGAGIALNTWRNGQATDTVGHLLHKTEQHRPD